MQEHYDITKLLQLIWAWIRSLKAVSVKIRAENSPRYSLGYCFFVCIDIRSGHPCPDQKAAHEHTDKMTGN